MYKYVNNQMYQSLFLKNRALCSFDGANGLHRSSIVPNLLVFRILVIKGSLLATPGSNLQIDGMFYSLHLIKVALNL